MNDDELIGFIGQLVSLDGTIEADGLIGGPATLSLAMANFRH
jgi:hypothetical protein